MRSKHSDEREKKKIFHISEKIPNSGKTVKILKNSEKL